MKEEIKKTLQTHLSITKSKFELKYKPLVLTYQVESEFFRNKITVEARLSGELNYIYAGFIIEDFPEEKDLYKVLEKYIKNLEQTFEEKMIELVIKKLSEKTIYTFSDKNWVGFQEIK